MLKNLKRPKKGSKSLFDPWLEGLEAQAGLEDFDSRPFWTPRRRASTDYLDDMWASRSFRTSVFTVNEDLVTAHRMVSSFVNALSRGKGYEVLFDQSTSSAGTDMKRKKVYITTAPVLDQSIDAKEAGRVLTALGVHEICHPRYGTDTADAVREVWVVAKIAHMVSNLLDDIRIEARFVSDYPGYSGVFDPMLRYLGKATIKQNGGQKLLPADQNVFDIAVAATRYPETMEWQGWESERRWWEEWAARWSVEDSPRRHVQGVREALQHMAAATMRKNQTGDARKGQGKGAQSGKSDGISDGKRPSEEAPGTGEGNVDDDGWDAMARAQRDGDLPVTIAITDSVLPADSGTEAVNAAARENGVLDSIVESNNQAADNKIKEAKFYEQSEYGAVDVVRTPQQLPAEVNDRRFTKSDLATRYVRDALMRSRTGHTGESRFRKRGKLDRLALSRTAHGDYRLFTRRVAQSKDKFLIWLMVDVSGSMKGQEVVEAAQVATAFAEASAHVKGVRMSVWAWSNQFRFRASSPNAGTAGAARMWSSGEPTRNIAKLIDLQKGGTPDATVMGWAGKSIASERKRDERAVILMCSDGAGSTMMNNAVQDARDRGVEVYGVSFGLSDEALKARYGEDGYVSWAGSIVATAAPLADLVSRMVSPRFAR